MIARRSILIQADIEIDTDNALSADAYAEGVRQTMVAMGLEGANVVVTDKITATAGAKKGE